MTYRRLATIMGCLMGCLALAPAALPAQIGAIQITPTRGENVSRVGTRGANFLQLGVGARPSRWPASTPRRRAIFPRCTGTSLD